MPFGQVGVLRPLDPVHGCPVEFAGVVRALHERDAHAKRQAVVDCGHITVIVTEQRKPFHYINDFTTLGLDLKEFKILAARSVPVVSVTQGSHGTITCVSLCCKINIGHALGTPYSLLPKTVTPRAPANLSHVSVLADVA